MSFLFASNAFGGNLDDLVFFNIEISDAVILLKLYMKY